jgi:hypothetical protein
MFEVDWDRIGWETVTLSYAIETEVQSYQDASGWGSFCLALGIPMLLTPINGWFEQSRSDDAILGAIRSIDLKLRVETCMCSEVDIKHSQTRKENSNCKGKTKKGEMLDRGRAII